TERFDFEVHCPEGEIVVHAGRVSCDNGVLNVISPKCGKPCTYLPKEVKCFNISIANPGDKRNCGCNRNCRTVEMTCDLIGNWTNFNPCSDEYEKQTFHLPNIGEYEIAASKKPGNNFEHIVYCSKKYVTISNGSAVCINAEFNITQHPRCEPPCEGFPSNVNCSATSSGNF
ncbi:hypothetical protein B566_EDAN011019, partial [Ephemera danica]